jgi:hypothetical protein
MRQINTSLRIYSALIDFFGPVINNTVGIYNITMPSLKKHSYVYNAQIRHLDTPAIASMEFVISNQSTIFSGGTVPIHSETEANYGTIYSSVPGGGYAKTTKFYKNQADVIPAGGGTVQFATGFQYGAYASNPNDDPFQVALVNPIVPTVPPLTQFRIIIDFFVSEHQF